MTQCHRLTLTTIALAIGLPLAAGAAAQQTPVPDPLVRTGALVKVAAH